MPKISVIIPCYNAEAYIGNCLDHLLAQEYNDFDVYCVDDCSIDNTERIINEYQNRGAIPIHYLKNETNSGPAFSRNKAINESQSDLIAFCDADDYYDKDYLKNMVAEQGKNDADITICGYKSVYPNGKIIEHQMNCPQNIGNKEMTVFDVDSLWVLLVRRRLLILFPMPNIRNGEDMAIIPLLMNAAHSFAFVNACLYNYFYRPSSASVSSSKPKLLAAQLSFQYLFENLSQDFKKEMEYLGARNMVYGALLNLFKCSFDTKLADELLDKFDSHFPNWINNDYLIKLPKYKYMFVWCAHHRLYLFIKIYSTFHQILLKHI